MAYGNRPIRFGVTAGAGGAPWPEVVERWRRIEEQGFDTAWVSDHLCGVVGGNRRSPVMEGWALQAALAAATQRIRIGCLVAGNTYRHPAVLAKLATTVDYISGGRLNFGIGAGWSVDDHRPFGIPFYDLNERGERLDESLEVITRLWTQENADFEGRFYRLKDAIMEPKPVQKPHPPIMIGGVGERFTLRSVAKWADMWNAVGSPALFRQKTEVLERYCAELGRDPAEIEKSVFVVVIFADDPERKGDIIERRRGMRTGAPSQQPKDRQAPMIEGEAENAILIGSPEEVRRQMRSYVDVGVTHFILSALRPDAQDRFVNEIMPAFR